MSSACCSPERGRMPGAGLPASPVGLSAGALADPDLRWLDGGRFLMGSTGPRACAEDGEGPVRPVDLAPFGIRPTAVTNEEFARFVADTGYLTDAERAGWSFVFHLLLHPGARPYVLGDGVPEAPWWLAVGGASWRSPLGPGSSVRQLPNHPVVHVSMADAEAYCAWSATRLPTEEEWEYAARGGLAGCDFPWGDELVPEGQHRCNVWQGTFPTHNTADDGFVGTAPVGAYPPNGFGLYNVVGNVWEWCASPWVASASRTGTGPPDEDTGGDEEWVIRGGSYLCHDSYCNRYRVSARSRSTTHSSTGNTGFRVAADWSRRTVAGGETTLPQGH